MRSFMRPPPLTEAQVSAAEHELGVTFPAEYREYLLRVSAGGRLTRLEQTEAGWWWAGNGIHMRALLTEPFPHPDSYVDADEALWERVPHRAGFPDDESFATAHRVWVAELDRVEERKTAGAIKIEENGCGFATLLVITGPLAGTVWWDGRSSCDLIVPLSLDHAGGARPVRLGEWLLHGSWDLLPPGWG